MSPVWRLSKTSPANDRRQKYQTLSELEDSPRQAALRRPGLRSVSKSRELQRGLVRKAHRTCLNQNCRSRVLFVFDDTIVGKVAPTTHDPGAPFQTTLLNDAGAALGPMRRYGSRSRRSLSRCDFRTQRMLSQDQVLQNSPMLRRSKPFVPADTGNW